MIKIVLFQLIYYDPFCRIFYVFEVRTTNFKQYKVLVLTLGQLMIRLLKHFMCNSIKVFSDCTYNIFVVTSDQLVFFLQTKSGCSQRSTGTSTSRRSPRRRKRSCGRTSPARSSSSSSASSDFTNNISLSISKTKTNFDRTFTFLLENSLIP